MDCGTLIGESIDYTREALTGRWTTWLVFIICGLPLALIQFTFDPNQLVDKTTAAFHWEIIPWPQFITLIVAGFLLSFIVTGYLVRVYRGGAAPPVFDQWSSLYLDGIKLNIVDILWLIPAMLAFAISFAILFAGAVVTKEMAPLIILVALLLILVALVLMVIATLYSISGSIRFARTGSIREGVHFSAVSATIGRIGWLTYIVALIVLLVVWVIFGIVTMVFAVIPFVGWLFVLAVNPLFSVFSARYISRVYDHGISDVPATEPGNTP